MEMCEWCLAATGSNLSIPPDPQLISTLCLDNSVDSAITLLLHANERNVGSVLFEAHLDYITRYAT
jgi:hypothetical protein